MATIHNDEPTVVDCDAIGNTELVKRLGHAVVSAQPPQVFGVHGDWGSGKTSFLYQLQYYLTGQCPQQPKRRPTAFGGRAGEWKALTSVVWFEAWRYQHEAAPIVALLHEIRTQLPWSSKALEKSKKLLEVTIRGALLSLEDLTKKIGFQASKVEQAGRDWEAQHLATRLPSHTIRKQLDHVISVLLGRDKDPDRRLVILVDDLDRCEPEAAYQLLEGIKIYLNLPSCVFVLAMNQKIIEQVVAKHLPMPESMDNDSEAQRLNAKRRRRAKEYLEKLCTNVYHLPLVHQPAELLSFYLDKRPMWKEICAVVASFDCLPPLPRKIKGYAGLLLRFEDRLALARAQSRKKPKDPADPRRWARIAVIFTYLYHFQHDLYRLLWADINFYTENLLPWARGDGEKREHLTDVFESRRRPPSKKAEDRQRREALATAPETRKRHHDPAADNVLHIQALITAISKISSDEHAANLLE